MQYCEIEKEIGKLRGMQRVRTAEGMDCVKKLKEMGIVLFSPKFLYGKKIPTSTVKMRVARVLRKLRKDGVVTQIIDSADREKINYLFSSVWLYELPEAERVSEKETFFPQSDIDMRSRQESKEWLDSVTDFDGMLIRY